MSKQLTYHRPENLNAAHKLLARAGAQPLLLSPRMEIEPYAAADIVVDLSLLNLNYIKQEGETMRIGVMTTLQDVADSVVLRTLVNGVLPEAASRTAHLGLRNASTIGGVMINPQSAVEVTLALLCLGVNTGAYSHAPLQNEISFSVSSSIRAASERVGRTLHDMPIVAICIVMDDEKKVARIAAGGVGVVPQLVLVAQMGKAQQPSSLKVKGTLPLNALHEATVVTIAKQVQEQVKPVPDFRGSVDYQREMVGVLVQRALKRLEIL